MFGVGMKNLDKGLLFISNTPYVRLGYMKLESIAWSYGCQYTLLSYLLYW